MVDDELDAVELADVVSQCRVIASRVNHHRDAMLAGRCEDPLVPAFMKNFQIVTGSEADTEPSRRLSHLCHQVINFRIVRIETRYVCEARREACHRLLSELVFKAE